MTHDNKYPAMPTEEERLAMIEAVKNFDFDAALPFWIKVRDYYLSEMRPFDSEEYRKHFLKQTERLPNYYEERSALFAHDMFNFMLRHRAAEAMINLGRFEKDTKKAIEHYKQAIEIYPNNPKNGEMSEAIAEMEMRIAQQEK
ncbi:MAG: tetratricopeptide repeat protein [Candidatus Paceibacterota bacterium]|jgi:tetratricopeptide (TPR) repeat protein|nr:tetratricopeptide repeat protein [Candidatus Paceibacterota bacterium]